MAVMEIGKFTQTDNIKFKYTWTIHNFSKRSEENSKRINSPQFPGEDSDELQWQLILYPRGLNLECENFVSIFIELRSPNIDIGDIPGNLKLKILNFPSKDVPIRRYHHVDDLLDNTVVGFDKFIERDVLLNKLIDDKVIVFCEITTRMNSIKDVAYRSRLANDFDFLFEYQDFSDVTFIMGKRKIKAHKAILGARSPVFRAMFRHNMKENLENLVDIPDIRYEVVKEMLRYIYTDKIQNLEKVKVGLLIAADKYQLDGLKAICEKALLSIDISVENFFEIFLIAENHRAHLLKAVVLNYIRTHSRSIVTTPGWKKLMEEYPDLVEEAFCALSEKSATITSLKCYTD